MTGEPHIDPLDAPLEAPRPPQQGKDIAPKLGRERPGRGLDTGVHIGAMEPGANNDPGDLS